MEQFESLREAESLRFRFQMNNRLRLESLAAVSKVFREFGEPISDDLLSSLVFAVPSELIPSNDFGYVAGAEDLHAGQYDPSAPNKPPQAPGPPQGPPPPNKPPQAPGPPQGPPPPNRPPQAPGPPQGPPPPNKPPQAPGPPQGPPPGQPPGMPPGPPQAPNP